MTTTRRDEANAPRAADGASFVRWLAAAYTPPPLTEARRHRFDARLAERLGARTRRQPWLAAIATVAAALIVWAARVPSGGVASVEKPNRATASAEAVLALATNPVADAEEALPTEYRAISYLLIDAEGDTIR